MKKLSIILACVLVAMVSCTKSKEVYPEIGDGNDEIVTVGMKDVHVEYTRTDHAKLNRVVFHYCPADANGNAQQFMTAEMTKKEIFFELTLNDLLSNTLYWYYYELFPNSGTATSTTQKTFRTQAYDAPEPPTPPSGVPEGAINGLFTINAKGDQVYFSQGNLQYNKTTATWSFMEHQYDIVETDEQIVGTNYANQNIVSLLGWGTSGWDNGNIYYQPYDTESSCDTNISCGYGPTDGTNYLYDLTGMYANADWGVYNAISNGGNTPNQWRTLTILEWDYVFNGRTTSSDIRYAMGIVTGVNGIILLPDGWNSSIYTLNYFNSADASYSTNEITLAEWTNAFETNGAVFLPAAGYRRASEMVGYVGYDGTYWSVVSGIPNFYAPPEASASFLSFREGLVITDNSNSRSCGRSVRLVQDANK